MRCFVSTASMFSGTIGSRTRTSSCLKLRAHQSKTCHITDRKLFSFFFVFERHAEVQNKFTNVLKSGITACIPYFSLQPFSIRSLPQYWWQLSTIIQWEYSIYVNESLPSRHFLKYCMYLKHAASLEPKLLAVNWMLSTNIGPIGRIHSNIFSARHLVEVMDNMQQNQP